MAAGMYLLLMWGYVSLHTPQLYAAFVALILSVALVFWVSEARTLEKMRRQQDPSRTPEADARPQIDLGEPTLAASVVRLDSLKSELMQQYAQFGRDQSLLNVRGLGTWQQNNRQQNNNDGEAEP